MRLVNYNGNQLLLSNVFVLSGFSSTSLENMLDELDEDEYGRM